MRILAIETSCDETALSLVEATGGLKNPSFSILSNIVASQIALHAQYGGVFPMMAKREHAKNIFPLFTQILKDAKLYKEKKNPKPWDKKMMLRIEKLLAREEVVLDAFLTLLPAFEKPKIDAIAVTYGPGLEPALWVGVNFAKALAAVWDIPLVPVNHMEGHVLSVLIQEKVSKKKLAAPKVQFPALALLISGGHTEVVLMKDWMKYSIVGQTRDDAVGEAFDKVARMLGLTYPGGPKISKLAAEYREGLTESGDKFSGPRISSPAAWPDHENLSPDSARITLPRPMIHSKDFDFSFSGLKTAVLYTIKKLPKLTDDLIMEIACEFENAAAEVLVKKTLAAGKKYKAKTLIVGGGVAANTFIRETLKTEAKSALPKAEVYFPEKELATDNSLMIGIAGYFQFLKKPKGIRIESLKAVGNLKL